MKLKEDLLEKRTIYKGRILSLRTDTVRLPNGRVSFREIVEHTGGAAVLAVDRENFIYLVKQYRYPYQSNLLEIPAGKLMIGEDPIDCARRELEEETGIKASSIVLLNVLYPSPGYTDEKIYVYLAKDFVQGNMNLDTDEFVELVKLPFDEALDMVNKGKIRDAKTIVSIYNYAIRLKNFNSMSDKSID